MDERESGNSNVTRTPSNIVINDVALERALNRPSSDYAIRGLFYGVVLGVMGGAAALGYGGFELGEWINDSLAIANNIARYSIDFGLVIVGGAVGIPVGGISGGIAGLISGGATGTIKEGIDGTHGRIL